MSWTDTALHDWLALVIATVTAVYTFATRRDDRINRALAQLQSEVQNVDDRLIIVEQKVAQAPSQDDLHRLELGMAAVSGSLKVLAERIAPIAATVERLQLYLLEREQPTRVRKSKKMENDSDFG